MSNLMGLTEDGKIGPVEIDQGGGYWLEMFTDCIEEYKLRGENFPEGMMDGASLPKPSYPDAPRALRIFSQLRAEVGNRNYLLKFGELRYLKSDFESGLWRIAGASSYSDPSLNSARRDEELELTVFGQQAETLIQIWDHKTGRLKGATRPIGNLAITSKSSTDYYVSCLSKRFNLRLFDDFSADCVIVIRNPHELAKRIFHSAKRVIPGWKGFLKDVTYIDPFNPRPDSEVFSAKHFRYWYQHEVRFLWIPPDSKTALEAKKLDIGDISDIAELLKL